MVGRIRGVSTVVGNISVVQAKFFLNDGHGSVLKAETEERRRYVDSAGVSLFNRQPENSQESHVE